MARLAAGKSAAKRVYAVWLPKIRPSNGSLKFRSELGLIVRDSKIVVSSREVARVFGKEHFNVLQDIKKLGCSEEFRALNFQGSSYLSEQNKEMPEYLITRDGFTILAMGYTGEKAMSFLLRGDSPKMEGRTGSG